MAYDKNTWKSGDVVTSAKLNNIENGIANCNGLITGTLDEGTGTRTLSVSYNDVLRMINTGIVPFSAQGSPYENAIVLVESYGFDNSISRYYIQMGSIFFRAESADELLVFVDDGGEA